MRPLKVAVYHSMQVGMLLEREIDWLALLVKTCEEVGEGGFDEARHMEKERTEMIGTADAQFDAAIEALQALRKEDLAVMRKYEHPPLLVLETMEAVMILRGDEMTSWEEAKFLLCDTYFFAFFVAKAKSYDKASITDDTLDMLRQFIMSPDFEPNVVAEASVPCGAICRWIRALYLHAKLIRITAPKQRTLQELRECLQAVREKLQAKITESAGAEQKLEALQREFQLRRKDLKERYDHTMNPLQDKFLEAHQHYGETFCSPRRGRFTAGITTGEE
eukprot:Rhum_TRINITY_DN7510_c0_g1::Rhum_TRINITY_DN7510_c0_g1_i2::g.23282::m.23282